MQRTCYIKGMPRAFRRSEAGNITIFAASMVILILIIAGASVDIMRYESIRSSMQTMMDRAVLAAADLDQQQDPTTVVDDYLSKAGLQDAITTVQVDEGLNYRTVSAQGQLDINTIFLKMAGFEEMAIPARSVAEEKISNVEISMVLDISGSMRGNRMTNMKNAAVEFIDTVIQGEEEAQGVTSVSLVPYSATVNLGPTMARYWNLSDHHTYSNCARFPNNTFGSTAISPTQWLERLGHFALYGGSSAPISSPWCPEGESGAIMAHATDRAALKNRVNALQAWGNTAIDLGMKWGVGLLDPVARPAISAMAADNLVVDAVANRPAEFSDPEAIKFIVVMTDGENTTEYDLKQDKKSGMSDIWVDDRGTSTPKDDRYSIQVRDWKGTRHDRYYWPRYRNYHSNYKYRSSPDGGSNARRMSNAELYATFSISQIANTFYYTPYRDKWLSFNDYYNAYYSFEAIVGRDQANSRLDSICSAAKAKDIVIFAIAFEAPPNGQAALKSCASSPSHYFDVEGVEITETFHAIARQINSLRLIQ